MRLIDADRLLEERRLHLYYHLPNGDTAIPIIDIKHAPTVNNDEWIPVREGLPEEKDGRVLIFDIKVNNDEWIPVSERLPEKPKPDLRRGWYLVALESGCVMSLGFEYDGRKWFSTASPVTHWMPLPQPPKRR